MAGVETGLALGFYLYPCGLCMTLFLSRLVRYRYRTVESSRAGVDEKAVRAVESIYAWLIWATTQLLLAPLLIASIVIALRSALNSHDGDNFPYSAYLASHTGVLLYFLAGLLPDPDGPWTATVSHCHAWVVGILLEALLAAVLKTQNGRIHVPYKSLNILFALGLARIAVFFCMTAMLVRREVAVKRLERAVGPENSPLIGNGDARENGYGAISVTPAPKRSRDAQASGWFDYFAGFRVLFPYLWPSGSTLYQAIVFICVGLLIAQRIINVLVPYQLGVLVATLGYGRNPYKEMLLYVLYRGLQGNNGIIGAARAVLWIPVSQALFRRLSCASFEHVLGLSMDFHLSKKIGEVTSALSRGAAMGTFLESFLFQVFPMVFDIFVAAVYFLVRYDAFYSLIVLVIMWSYIFLTMYMAKYRGRQRREMAIRSREMDAAKTDAIMAYETVQHNCALHAETDRFSGHVTVFQRAERLVQLSLNWLNLTQSTIFTLGTAMIVAVSAYKISHGQQDVAGFVSLITYFAQLQAPLNFFGTYYTMLQNNLIEAERMLDLFKETPGIVEKPDARELGPPRGEVRFNNVKFSYQGKEAALGGVSFTVQPGTKTALVGESGSGKSTCLRLLYRFYDVSDGSITIDGSDLRDLKLKSLRKHIGVVPQDTVLFNATVMYNLLYANPRATEEDVFAACKAANIHERIMAFPERYETKVGERGLKLSGGERQRIAIARAILKDARILLLDEATASLDTLTERQIQEALERVTAGRTTITIAHRLSTITTSDQIIVLHKGKVVECGTHHDLLALGGSYHAMWEKQTNAEKEAVAKAEAETEG